MTKLASVWRRSFLLIALPLAAAAVATAITIAQGTQPSSSRRPQGPCDIYAAAGDPCVAAHSTTRALYAAYSGPLYQVLRQSDGKTMDIGVVAASAADAGGYANAAAQDTFCANTYCWIAKIYDQSPKHNDLTQAPRGGFSGPAMGGFNNVPIADMAPVTVMGHKVYGVFIEPGMGLREDDPRGTAVDDQAEGQYWVINGLHHNSGCCFDYGNAETDSRDDGNGTMETTYFGDATGWYHGPPPGPWVMTDQENNLVGCVNADQAAGKACDLPNVTWRFVTAMAKGEPHHWTSLGGDAQQGSLKVMFDGPRVDRSYDPMRKQGAILLGNGGDNSNGSQGTFYEGAMTAAGTFPTDATDQLVQANVVAAKYDVASSLTRSGTGAARARSVSPVKINEFQIAAGAPANPTNAFIELFNAGTAPVDISGWTVTEHAIQQATFSNVKIPAGTRLAAGGFYLLGLSDSGLISAARKGDANLYIRSTTGMAVGDSIQVDTGAGVETRKIASLGTAAANSTTLWQPLPDGPVMTVPVGATNVPVTNITGFAVGEKIALGYGATYPVVGMSTEKYEVATVTAVGKPGTQGRLSAAAPAGTSIVKVGNVDNISVGDKIRLDIASVGHGIETVTVTVVGTPGPNGTGLTIAEKLKFDHASNIPFSDRGTGITFTPATTMPHSSNEPVQALGTGITLDAPLARDHAIDAVVRDSKVTDAGYQGSKAPDLWFGGPAFSANAGSIALRDAAGLVVDSLNYGALVDPWLARGDQSVSGAGQNGCRAPVPGTGLRGGGGAGAAAQIPGFNRSAGRFPDGADTDSNCSDFVTQVATTMPAGAAAGATNIKVASVADFAAGQTVIVGSGANAETVAIGSVGTAGATTITENVAAGLTAIRVASGLGGAGFTVGQSVTIGSGPDAESVTIAPTPGGGRGGATGATITVASPLKSDHAAGSVIAGTGITLTSPLKNAHGAGAPVATDAPTPGAPNKFIRK